MPLEITRELRVIDDERKTADIVYAAWLEGLRERFIDFTKGEYPCPTEQQ